MINISRLLMGDAAKFPGDGLRFGTGSRGGCPVVVWHITDLCNLGCRHCYSAAAERRDPEVMDEAAAADFLGSLAALRPPVLLLSGGEPLLSPKFFPYLALAGSNGIKVSVSTNGTLIDRASARKMVDAGVLYAGVSIDGVGGANDEFRGKAGAFDEAVRGIDIMASLGCRAGLRVTLASPVLEGLSSILDLALELPISRICFYHFVPSGRGASDGALMPGEMEERGAVLEIIDWAEGVCASRRDDPLEILTVGDASSGVLTYKFLLGADRARAESARHLLMRSSARRGFNGILSVRWDGLVFKNQFSWDRPLCSWKDLTRYLGGGRIYPSGGDMPKGEGDAGKGCSACKWGYICSGSLRDRCLVPPGERVGP
jgi:MoaA/NifB/PqqE/SkfB family radical SAM enzyme